MQKSETTQKETPLTAFACSTVSRLRVKTHSSRPLSTNTSFPVAPNPLSLLVNKVKQQQHQKTETRYLQEQFCVRPPGRHSVSDRQAQILCQTARHTFCVRPPGTHSVSDRRADILCQTAGQTLFARGQREIRWLTGHLTGGILWKHSHEPNTTLLNSTTTLVFYGVLGTIPLSSVDGIGGGLFLSLKENRD